jgi:beta-lactamase superfamily II metal-dependent hydrolase
MASSFGVLSLVGPVANAVVIPAVPALVVLGWAGAALATAAPALGWPPLAAAGLMVGAIVALARALAAVPLASLHIGTWPRAWTWVLLAGACAGAAGWWAAGRARRSAPAWGAAAAATGAVITLLVLSRPDGRLHVTVLDTGGSAAILVRAGDGATALVDGGSDPLRLGAALERTLPPLTRSLDLVVLSGGDRTTAGGLAGLAGSYRVGTVVAPATALGPGATGVVEALRATGSAVVRAPSGRTWLWHATRWRLLLAQQDPGTGAPSGAVRVAASDGAALVLGALAPPGQEELAGAEGSALRSDLLVTPGRGAVAPALLEAVRPRELAVPSARAPRPLEDPGLSMRSTAVDGTLEYAGGPDGLQPG